MDNVAGLATERLVYEIMAEVSRNKVAASQGRSPRWLDKATDFLNDNFFEPFTIDYIAGIAGVHPVMFRRYHHCTIGEYVRKLRIEFACREISTTDCQLALIASLTGFYDQSHFSRTFNL